MALYVWFEFCSCTAEILSDTKKKNALIIKVNIPIPFQNGILFMFRLHLTETYLWLQYVNYFLLQQTRS